MATGITIRHHRQCPTRDGGKCGKPCTPAYESWVWDRRERKKIAKRFASLTEAKNWRGDAVPAARKGAIRATSRETLREAWGTWLEKAKAGEVRQRGGDEYKPSTLRGYEHDVKKYVLDDLGDVRLTDIRANDVQGLVDGLLGQELSGSKVRNVLVPLQALYRRHRRTVPIDPTRGLDLPAPSAARERAATPAEAAELLAALPDDQRALWATAFYAGLRRGELRALRAEDIDLEANELHVHRGWDDVAGEIAPKSRKGERHVPIAGTLRLVLLEHVARTGRRGTHFVFGRTSTDPFTPTTVRKAAIKAWTMENAKRTEKHEKARAKGHPAVLVPIGLHECRHTYVSLMHAAGCSLEEIGDYVGHASSYMTDRYRHLLDGQREEAAKKLERFLTGAQTGAHTLKAASLSGKT